MKLPRLLCCLRGEDDTMVSYSGRRVEQFRWQDQPVVIDRMPPLPLSPCLRPGAAPSSPSCLQRQGAFGPTSGSEFHTFHSSGEGQGQRPGFLSVSGAPSTRLVSVDLSSPGPARRAPARPPRPAFLSHCPGTPLPSHYPGTPLPQSCRPAALLGAVAVLPGGQEDEAVTAQEDEAVTAQKPVTAIPDARSAEPTDTVTVDTTVDSAVDTTVDTTVDSAVDTTVDTAVDAAVDSTPDSQQTDSTRLGSSDKNDPSPCSSTVSPAPPCPFLLPSPLPWPVTKRTKRVWGDQPNV